MEQDRIHIKLARRTPEERQADETRRLDPFMRALKAIHTAATPETMNVEDLEKQRKGQELLGRLVAPMAGMSWEPFELDGIYAVCNGELYGFRQAKKELDEFLKEF